MYPVIPNSPTLVELWEITHLNLQNENWMCCHVVWSDYRRGFGLDIEFIDHLYTKLETTSNYSATANLHTLQITTAHAKSFPACCVFTSRSLVTASNSGDSSASALKCSLNGGSPPTDNFLHRLPYRTDLVAPIVFLITPRYGPRPQHSSFSYANRFRGNVFTEPFPSSSRLSCLLRICCLVTGVPLSVSRTLPRNESCFRAVP
jgi:hypothetical protein